MKNKLAIILLNIQYLINTIEQLEKLIIKLRESLKFKIKVSNNDEGIAKLSPGALSSLKYMLIASSEMVRRLFQVKGHALRYNLLQ